MTSKWELKLRVRAPQNIKNKKNEHSKNTKKTALQKVMYGCDLASKMVDPFASKTLPKSQQSQKSSKWAPGPPK